MIKAAIPVLHVSNSAAAKRFYCEQLGFRREFAYRADESRIDPCYTGITREQVEIHLSSFSGDGVAGAVVNFVVDDVDAMHAEFRDKNVPIEAGHPVNQTWGTREMYVTDADGNSLRFQKILGSV